MYIMAYGQDFLDSNKPVNLYHSLGKFSKQQMDIFSYFFQEIRFGITCALQFACNFEYFLDKIRKIF